MIYAKKFFVERTRPWWAVWREDQWSVYSHGSIAKGLEGKFEDCPILRAVVWGEDAKANAEQIAITFQALWEKGDTLSILKVNIASAGRLWRDRAAETDRKIQSENWQKIVEGVQADCEADERKANPSV